MTPGVRASRWIMPGAPGSRVTRLELLYDLIFVFAFLNVTVLVGNTLRPRAIIAGIVVLALLWWCWSGLAALGNITRANRGALPLIGFATMAAAFILALTIPQAFMDQPGELRGPVVFAVAYLMVRALTVGAFWFVTTPGTPSRRRLWLLTAAAGLAAVLVLTAALASLWAPDPRSTVWIRIILWCVAMVMEAVAARTPPYSGWAGLSAGHWAERHALIVLVAIGESVISLGLGAGTLAELTLTVPIIVAAVLGIALVATLWWLHYDTFALAVEQVIHGVRDKRRIPLTRDVYTYLHLLLIMGIIGTALGLKLVVRTVAGEAGRPLNPTEARILYLGVVVFLLAEISIALRTFGVVPRPALFAAAALTAVAAAADRAPALAALGFLTTACVMLALDQRLRQAAFRQRVRQSAFQEEQVVETALNRWRVEHRQRRQLL
ncbi:low temperature requirement protein A [Plantactinospora sp. KLBMP9567]|uniref:low temperature requirement protein A n=1 Tax=Plantactinospora sp. KLBMP9567 TaxID=3085900 RepID=UPI002981A542|nr:low temperature requirement protein A [Plantactinospora sp. KLBMP9567]MDW5328908.1 low temperature requirement protein A [Plantactinospora sp. KLBMP9567]